MDNAMDDSYNDALIECMKGVRCMESSMESTMHDASMTENRRKRVKPKVLKEAALDAGLAALAALESSDVAPRPVTITARTLVAEGIESIMRLRNRNVPLLRIYTDMRKASGIRISFATFAGYVSEASKAKGIKLEKAKAEAGPAARPQPRPEPASVTVEAPPPPWNCDRCRGEAERRESTKKPGTYFWKCPECNTFYQDDDGTITNKRIGG